MIKLDNPSLKPSAALIVSNRCFRYIHVGAFLHFIAIAGICLFAKGIQVLLNYEGQALEVYFFAWIILSWFAFWLPFFAELDAYCRFQNYKLLKDKLYINGFDHRLVKPFMYSKCQRISILIAAKDLRIEDQVNDYFYKEGYRWYHFIPDLVVTNPLVLGYKKFWDKILFTKYYELQNFYW